MTHAELAKALHVARSTVTRDVAAGMPLNIRGAQEWRNEHKNIVGEKTGPKTQYDDDVDDIDDDDDGALSLESLGYELPVGDDIDALLLRNQEREKTLFAKLTAAEKYLATNRNPKLAARLNSLQTQHLAASKMVAAIMNTRSEMVARSKTVIPRAEFEEKLLQTITVLSMFVMNLPGRIRSNPEVKPLLVAIAQSWDLEIALRLLYDLKLNVTAPQWEQEFERYVAERFRIDYEKLLKLRSNKGFKPSPIQPDDNAIPKDKLTAFQESLNDEQNDEQ